MTASRPDAGNRTGVTWRSASIPIIWQHFQFCNAQIDTQDLIPARIIMDSSPQHPRAFLFYQLLPLWEEKRKVFAKEWRAELLPPGDLSPKLYLSLNSLLNPSPNLPERQIVVDGA